jgi:hypothetical protein
MSKKTIRKFTTQSSLQANCHPLADVLQALTQARQWCCEDEELSKRIETAMYSVANELCNTIEKDYLPEKQKFSVKTESSITLEAQDEEEATKKVYNSMMEQADKNGLNIKDWDIKAKEA